MQSLTKLIRYAIKHEILSCEDLYKKVKTSKIKNEGYLKYER